MLEISSSSVRIYDCPECGLCFATKPFLEAHQRTAKHACCSVCTTVFPTHQLHAAHMRTHLAPKLPSPRPATQFRCCDCERDFGDETALSQHLRDSKVHKPPPKSKAKKIADKQQQQQNKNPKQEKDQPSCEKCNQTFKTAQALAHHLSSVRHNPLSNISCLASKECKKRFNCPSAQLHHLESGTCVSGATRAKLNAVLAAQDTKRIITTVTGKEAPLSLLTSGNTPSMTTSTPQLASPILTPTSSQFLDSYPPSGVCTPKSTLSPDTDVNSVLAPSRCVGHGPHTCPLCPTRSTRKYTPEALQDYLSLSVHGQAPTIPTPSTPTFHSVFANPATHTCPLCPPSSTRKFTPDGLQDHLSSSAHAQASAPPTPSTPAFTDLSIHSVPADQAPRTCPLCPPSRMRKFTPEGLRDHLSSSVHAQAPATPTPSAPAFGELSIHSMLAGQTARICPLCPPSSTRTFMPEALEQHLSSSVHEQVSACLTKPALEEVSPALNEVSPALNEVSPALNEVSPALNEVSPALNEVSPALNEVSPALDEMSPALNEVSLALNEVSPALDEVSFHCPRGLMRAESKKREKHFSTVSGLAQHLESGACGGGKDTMKRVVTFVQEVMMEMGFGGVRLLE